MFYKILLLFKNVRKFVMRKVMNEEYFSEKLITVGIDFGTSRTKIVYRDVAENIVNIILFEDMRGNKVYFLPSLVSVKKGKLYFGYMAEEIDDPDYIFRSFKTCLACQGDSINRNMCRKENIRGFFIINQGMKTFKISALQITIFYLAWLIKFVKKQVEKIYTKPLKFVYTMGIPINYLENESVRDLFMKAIFYAERLSEEIEQEFDIEEAINILEKKINETTSLPPDEVRLTFVQPESIASVISYIESPEVNIGLHTIIDIGAATSDITVFRLMDYPDKFTIHVYASDSYLIGCDDMDSEIFDMTRKLVERNPMDEVDMIKLLNQISRSKDQLTHSSFLHLFIDGKTIIIPSSELENIWDSFVGKLRKYYEETWHKAYPKEKRESHWKEYALFMLGGGSRIPYIKRKISNFYPWNKIEKIIPLEMKIPAKLKKEYADSPEVINNFDLLSVAYGLSIHPARWPKMSLPSNVEPLVFKYKYAEKLDRDQLYPK